MEKTTMHDLPQELIVQVLLTLPVKSLVRFKCVCKSWLSLISDPHFASLHYGRAVLDPCRLVLFAPCASEFRSIDSNASIHDDSASAALNLSFLSLQPHYHVEILGSCRGFLLLESESNLCLWNPSTGVHRLIPPYVNARFFSLLHGFGYDPSTDDYVVVVAFASDGATPVELFSLRANVWKEIGGLSNIQTAPGYPELGSLFNGVIHWMAYRCDLHVNVILAFDLKERSFSEIPLPDDSDLPFRFELSYLHILGGFLSLCYMDFDNKATEIWVMEEYKVLSSWRKTIVMCNDNILTQCLFPLCFTKSGDIVGMLNCKELVKCDDKGQVKERRAFCFCHGYDPGFQVAVYTESLLSLPGDHAQQAS